MSHISSRNHSHGLDKHQERLKTNSKYIPKAISPTLDEIQLRACRIHSKHGGVCGGYNLDDWFEAEHELEDENRSSAKTERVQ